MKMLFNNAAPNNTSNDIRNMIFLSSLLVTFVGCLWIKIWDHYDLSTQCLASYKDARWRTVALRTREQRYDVTW